jgi:hypothetical protein
LLVSCWFHFCFGTPNIALVPDNDADPVAGTIAAAASQWWHKAITTSSTSPSVNVFATTASAAALGF